LNDHTSEEFSLASLFCIGFHRIQWNQCTEVEQDVPAQIEGLTLRVASAQGFEVYEIALDDLGPEFELDIKFLKEDSDEGSDEGRRVRFLDVHSRLALTSTGNDTECVFHVGECDFSPDGCYLYEITDQYIHCRCTHFSDFSLLFGDQGDDWTTIRIVSVSLLAAVWVSLFLFGMLLHFSATFRRIFHLETSSEKEKNFLGNQLSD
jgi:GPCR proteolysis site, GPS, motif